MRKLLKRLLPSSLRQSLRAHFDDDALKSREFKETQIPKVKLQQNHVQNCKLLLDRRTLLENLPKRGTFAELGVNKGDFSAEILEIVNPDAFHLVDIWASERYHEGLFTSIKTRFEAPISSGQMKIHRMLSTDAAQEFSDGYFDCVYIDTCHSYETTRQELMKYESKIKPGGFIAGHDYSMGNWIKGLRYGVIEAVHEFCVSRGWELIYLTIEPTESQSFAIRRIRS